MKKRKLQTNKKRPRRMIQCRTQVNREHIRRETIDGVEHIIVSSATLPDDIVMNGILYPAEEIAKSFLSLERSLAPVEHPTDASGFFISANDPIAIHNFYAGAFNENVRRENGRVFVDKVINVQEAVKTDRGKRLLDRIDELENNSDPRPVHTSVGVFLEVEELDNPVKQVNGPSAGTEFIGIARNMVFDHDAILLDSVGAATPQQGVGLAVNREGEEIEVDLFIINTIRAAKNLPLADSETVWDKAAADKRVREASGPPDESNNTYAQYCLWKDTPFVDIIDGEAKAVPAALRNAAARLDQTQGLSANEKETIRGIIDGYLDKITANAEHMLHSEIEKALDEAIRTPPLAGEWVLDFSDVEVIFIQGDQFFSAPFILDDGRARIVGIPIPVDRDVTFNPKTNQKGDAMKELMLKALAAAKISVNTDISDADLLVKYNELQANQNSSDDDGASDDEANSADVIANALKPLLEKMDSLEAKLNSQDDAELTRLADLVGNSDKYPALDAEAAKKLGVDTLKSMAANCATAHGIPLTVVPNNNDDDNSKSFEMPK